MKNPVIPPTPLVSIIMSVFNGADLLDRCLQSILGQTFEEWELLVVDDGSCDGTGGILAEWAQRDSRVVPLHRSVNRGLAAGLNLAIGRSRGRFVARMDHDDVSLPDRLKAQVNFMKMHEEVDILGTGIHVIDKTGRTIDCRFRPEKHEELVRRIFYENPFYHPTVMARRAVFEVTGGYNERYRRAQDYDLWLRAYRRFRFHNLQIPLVLYSDKKNITLQDSLYSVRVLLSVARRERIGLSNVLCSLRIPIAGITQTALGPVHYSVIRKMYQAYKTKILQDQDGHV